MRKRYDQTQFREKFWTHVDPSGSCWIWVGTRFVDGYGAIMQWVGERSLRRKAHRVAWELCCGPIPAGMFVLHRCDVRACVNPEHLYLGTHLDNMRDEVERRRSPHGERHYNAKLTRDQVREIKSGRGRKTGREIASEMNVSRDTIYSIWHGRHRRNG